MKLYIYKIVEVNVDGCGTDAWEYVSFPYELSTVEINYLKECLKEVKAKKKGEDYETYDFIDIALNKFERMTGLKGNFVSAPFTEEIVF